jgi:hypothetical protein
VLETIKISTKALGMGESKQTVEVHGTDHLAQLANRLIDLQSNIRKGVTINGKATQLPESPEGEYGKATQVPEAGKQPEVSQITEDGSGQ